MKPVTSFSIGYKQYLSDQGEVLHPLPDWITPKFAWHLYDQIQFVRLFDEKAIALQRTGLLGTFPSSLGQEAISVSIGLCMKKQDVFCPYYREHGALFQRGVSPEEVFAYWGGDERGSNYQKNPYDFPVSVPIASQCLHAAGVAFAFQYQKASHIAVTTLGDGATSKGDFYEAMNVAGVWKLPVVFIINNNQWAISVSRYHQTATITLAQKAISANLSAYQVDGNDPFAICIALREAFHKARKHEPILLEMLTYRLGDHTTADHAKRYIPKQDLQIAWQKEPLVRLKRYLKKQSLWDEDKATYLKDQAKKTIQKAAEKYLNTPPQQTTDLIDYLYADLPKPLQTQYDRLKADDHEQ